MTNIIVMGHGAYAAGTKENMDMIVGVPSTMHFLDLTRQKDLATLEEELDSLLETLDSEVLFVCDLMGASPFRIAAMKSAENPEKYCTVTGVNTMGFMELAMQNDMSAYELANHALEASRTAMVRFPE